MNYLLTNDSSVYPFLKKSTAFDGFLRSKSVEEKVLGCRCGKEEALVRVEENEEEQP